MDEHMFDPSNPVAGSEDEATVRAAELSEQIIDELTRPTHDWRTIQRLAEQLASLAGAAACR